MPVYPTSKHTKEIDTEAIRRGHDLVDIIGREIGTPLRRGNNFVWCCPFHEDTSPSFTVYRDGHYHCYGCGAHGDIITWTMQRRGMSFLEACRSLEGPKANATNQANPKPRSELDNLLPIAPPEQWQEAALGILADCEGNLWDGRSKESAQVRAYLAARGLQETILQDFFVGYNPVERRIANVKLWVPAGIVIPTWHAATNTLYGLNVRLSKEARADWKSKTGNDAKYLLASGSKRAPLGLENIRGKKAAFVLEGEFDFMLTWQTLRALGQRAVMLERSLWGARQVKTLIGG